MSERQPRDAAARLSALDPSRSFLVQAPAGSGKTELLTDRILALLAMVQRPEELVAITFTRKAAAEMHERVLAKLARAQAMDTPPDSEHQRRGWELARQALARDHEFGWNLLAHPARLSIRTIDSFCASLVRRMPWLSALGGMPGVANDARAHYQAAAQATLDMAGDVPEVRALLAHLDVDLAGARDALAQMLGQRDQWMPLLAHGSDRASLEASLHEVVNEQLQALSEVMPLGWAQALAGPARMAADTLQHVGGDNPLAALIDWQGTLSADAADLPRWRALAFLLLTEKGAGALRKPGGIRKDLGFPPKTAHKDAFVSWLGDQDPDASWCVRLAALDTVPAPTLSDSQWEILSAQLLALRLAAAQLAVRFAEAGEVDFIEIAQRAARALGSADDPGELLLALDAGIRHLLIDEFQDTSQTQIELLRTLTSGWQAGDGRTLFLVGDPMQSIYRFRKAEVGLFLQVRDQGIGEVRPEFLQLTDNFRSQSGIVEWVNRVFKGMLPAHDDMATGAIRYAPSVAFNPALDGDAVQVHTVWGSEQADMQAEETAVSLADEALKQGKSVAILVRARTHVGALARRLAQAQIPCRAVELVPLSRRSVVVDLVQLVRALAHPGDRMAWLSVLRAPWCGLTLTSLTHLFGHDHRTPIPVLLDRALRDGGAAQTLSSDEYARVARMAAILRDNSNAAGSMPFAAWVERLWERLGGPSIHAGPGDHADAQSLFRLVERIAPYGGLDVAQLDAELQRLYAMPGTGENAVEIMTMHKSKGLQFDTVILFGLHRLPRGGDTPLVRFEQNGGRVLMGPVKRRADQDADPLSRFLAAREKRREAYEVDRLLYVAATRARERLHLVGMVQAGKDGNVRVPPASTLLGRLWPYLGESQPLGTTEPAVAEDLAGPQVKGGLLRRLPAEAITASVAPVSPVGRVETAFSLARPDTYDDVVGTVAHAWLARIGDDGLDAWPTSALPECLPRMRRQLSRAGVPIGQIERCAQDVLDTLHATLASERGRWLLGLAAARREWPLVDLSGKVSVIDLAVSRDEGWLVVDYKTGRPRPDESTADFADRMRLRYRSQLERYCRHVTALDGRPARAALFFPRADLWIDMLPAEEAQTLLE